MIRLKFNKILFKIRIACSLSTVESWIMHKRGSFRMGVYNRCQDQHAFENLQCLRNTLVVEPKEREGSKGKTYTVDHCIRLKLDLMLLLREKITVVRLNDCSYII